MFVTFWGMKHRLKYCQNVTQTSVSHPLTKRLHPEKTFINCSTTVMYWQNATQFKAIFVLQQYRLFSFITISLDF